MPKQQITKGRKSKKQVKSKSLVTSKMALDENNIKDETIPNAVTLGGFEAIGLKRIPPQEIPKYLLMHPALPRGIELKANRMIKLVDNDLSNNVIINPTENPAAKEAEIYCRKVLADSGGPLFLKDMSMGAYRFGTSFGVFQLTDDESEVARIEHQHEIFFGPATYPEDVNDAEGWGEIPKSQRPHLAGKNKIDVTTKKISKFTQLKKKNEDSGSADSLGNKAGGTFVNTKQDPRLKTTSYSLVATGKEFDQSKVMSLLFDRIGDEPLGISLTQYLFLTITYLLNMEKGAAQTQVNFGFNRWKATTPFKDQNKIIEFANTLSNINVDAVVVLPKDVELDNIAPSRTDFDKVHPIFMQLIAIRLGIPLSILSQAGDGTNKSTLVEQRKDMYEDFIADELTIEREINNTFFKMCAIKYPLLEHKGLELIVPTFKFNQPPEDIDVQQDRNLKFSLMVRNYAMAMERVAGNKNWSGDNDSAKLIGEKLQEVVKQSMGNNRAS